MKLQKSGNSSKAVILTKTVLETTGFKDDDELYFSEISKGKLIIEKKEGDK